MKKIKALMVAFVLAGMTVVSCSSDDSSGPAPTIDGKWNQEKTVVKIADSKPQTLKYEDNTIGCDKNYIEFAPSSVFNRVVYFKQDGCQESVAEPGTWTKNDKILTITDGGSLSGIYNIVKLTSADLQIATSNEAGGVTTTTTVYFKKVK